MTPLRFRAWLPERKEMIPFGFASCDGELCQGKNGWDDSFMVEDAVVMQSTGLTDRNGKEIFEGDILRALAPRGPFATDRYEGQVTYATDMAMWEFRAIRVPFDLCPLKFASDPEVIGNVHENPDLLPQTK